MTSHDVPRRRVIGASRRVALAGTTLLAVLASGAVAGCQDAESAPDDLDATPSGTPDRDLSLRVPRKDAGASVNTLGNAGSNGAVIDVVAGAGGEVTASRTPGGRSALRFPKFSDSESGPAAMVRVRPAGSDWMNPGLDPFEFGVDVKLDADSSGTIRDNGDNVVQRGLFEDGAQFKLQIDKRVPSCVVTGDGGTVIVKERDLELSSDAWYRLTCERRAESLKLTAFELSFAQDGEATPGHPVVAEESGTIGRVEFLPTVPMSIGGKIYDGGPAPRTDQFNGLLSGAYLSIGQ